MTKQIFWKSAKLQDFIHAEVLDWIEGVGEITNQYEKKFINAFGEALQRWANGEFDLPSNTLEVLTAWKDFYLPVNGSKYDWEYYDELERSVIRDLQVNDIQDVIEFGRSQGWWKR
ncbi:MAG: hypothetical protein WC433_08450 [Candidatus Omnitrophota bacterium]